MLVGVAVVVLKGSIMQLILATVFSIICLAIQLLIRPYRLSFDSYLANTSSVSLAVLFSSCVVLKFKVLTEQVDIKARMSEKLVADFDVPSGFLPTVITICMVALLVVTGPPIILQFFGCVELGGSRARWEGVFKEY